MMLQYKNLYEILTSVIMVMYILLVFNFSVIPLKRISQAKQSEQERFIVYKKFVGS